jgi:transposase
VTKVRIWVGLDVHAAKVAACVVDAESGEMTVHRLPGETAKVVEFCAALPGPTRVAYEAGPTGFGLARALMAAGIGCVVAAPGKIERPARDRVKTDRRDAERLVRLLMIGGPVAVRVPGDEEEALRDLVRAREDVRGDLMRARHRLGKMLLRHDVRFEDTTSRWGGAPPRLAGEARPRSARRAGDAERLRRRDRRAGAAPRHARGGDRRARAQLVVGAHGRPA